MIVIEEWRDIEGYQGIYQISNNGRVKSMSRMIRRNNCRNFISKEKILKAAKHHNGYLFVYLSKSKKVKYHSISRLVAGAFHPRIFNKKEVNHIDGDKENNSSLNLEWVNRHENQLHSFRVLKRDPVKSWIGKKGFDHNKSKAVIVKDLNGNKLAIFGSLRQLSEKTKINRQTVGKIINTNKSFHNFKFESLCA